MTGYRRRLVIDHTRVMNVDQKNFPFLVSLTDARLKSASHGGRVASDRGEDIFFALPDGETRLAHETVAYAPETGALKAWVRVPDLSSSQDTEFFVYYGDPASRRAKKKVWDPHVRLVQHLHSAGDPVTVPHSDALNIRDEITVEAWVRGDAYQPEAMQALVSRWESLTSFNTFNAFDAGDTDGLDAAGFYGAAFDGRHVYFCPIRSYKSDRLSVHANVLRYDTQKDFHDPKSYEAYDASRTDGLRTVCYYGAVFDGRYMIFTPRDEGTGYHSRVLRYDTHGDFKDSASWEAFDAQVPDSHQSAAFDGRYIYFCPGYAANPGGPLSEATLSGKVLRLDTQADFKDPSSYRVFDVKAALGEEVACYDGGLFDGRHIYFVPLCTGVALQYDTRGDFEDRRSWRAYDAKPLGMGMNVGGTFDGRYIYFAAYANSCMVRYDTQGDFGDGRSWRAYDAANTSGVETAGFDGAYFDGRYVYYVPYQRRVKPGEDKSVYHGNYLRYDTLGPFDDPKSWAGVDAERADGLVSVGYNAGAFDGRYFYAAPDFDPHADKMHGRILRCDTTGQNASFCLKYGDFGHNGGLCAAAPGPSFHVNTVKGTVVGIAAPRPLLPGWHHLAGVYNGRTVKLFVDGALVGERPGAGALQTNEVDVAIGRMTGGAARFRGVIEEVRISDIARGDDWIKTAYQNLASPSRFVRAGEEERVA